MNHYELIKDIIDYIEDNLRIELSIKELAKKVHISPYYFQRIFQAITGYTVNKYIRNRRLSEAATELMTTSKSILDIAVGLEYGSQEAFTRAFQTHYGYTPLKFRKLNPSVTLFQKIIVDQLESDHMDIKHELITLDDNHIFGYNYMTRLTNMAYFKAIPSFYSEFGSSRRYEDILKRTKPAHSYGIVCDYEDDHFSFIIGERTDDNDQEKRGYRHITISGGDYAVFSLTGSVKMAQSTWRYIYGQWFNNTDFIRGDGYDFEVIDVSQSKYPNEIVMSIYIPIRKVK